MNILLMASGTGSNALNLLEYSKTLKDCQIKAIITDKKSSPLNSLDLAVPVYYIPKKKNMDVRTHEELILKKIGPLKIDAVFLCGYMKLLSSNFLNEFYSTELKKNAVFNIHPSLLPKYPGSHAYERAFEAADTYSGVTVHFVDEGMDTGEIIFQERFERTNTDTLSTFILKGKQIEWQIYPKLINWLKLKMKEEI
jgi:phosphoribosylglycinamide formyltransferase-1